MRYKNKCNTTDSQTHTHKFTNSINSPIISFSNKVFSSNVRGLIRNWNQLHQIAIKNYDVILLNEIWKINDFENIKIDNFNLATLKQRERQRGGGVLIYVKDNIEFEIVDSPYIEGIIETCSIKIKDTCITSLYRPPSGNKQEFIDRLLEWIESTRLTKILIAGDFNINALNDEISYLHQVANNANLEIKINDITRIQE